MYGRRGRYNRRFLKRRSGYKGNRMGRKRNRYYPRPDYYKRGWKKVRNTVVNWKDYANSLESVPYATGTGSKWPSSLPFMNFCGLGQGVESNARLSDQAHFKYIQYTCTVIWLGHSTASVATDHSFATVYIYFVLDMQAFQLSALPPLNTVLVDNTTGDGPEARPFQLLENKYRYKILKIIKATAPLCPMSIDGGTGYSNRHEKTYSGIVKCNFTTHYKDTGTSYGSINDNNVYAYALCTEENNANTTPPAVVINSRVIFNS